MSVYLFNVFIESKDNANITSIMTCLDANPRFFLKDIGLQTVTTSCIPL